jgi:PAS domain S-box-containing protein
LLLCRGMSSERRAAWHTDPARSARLAELEQRTQELVRSQARFRDVIERNADAIVVVDGDGVIRFANAAAAALFGSSREALVGSPFGFPVLAGETTELDLVQDAQRRAVEMRVVESEWEGDPAHIVTLRGITERRRAEEDMHRLVRAQAARVADEAAARRFRFLAEATTLLTSKLDYTETLTTLAELCVQHIADWAVIYMADDSGHVRRLAVAHRDPAKAAVVEAIQDHPIQPAGPHPVLQVLRTGEPVLATDVDESRLTELAQDERHLALLRELGVASFMLVPLVARERKLGAIGLISSDPRRPFTTQDLAEATDLALRAALAVDNARLYCAAQEVNQARTDLLAVISHDLRTPLSSIMGHAELLAMGVPEPLGPATLERVERIRAGAKHLVYLIDELLTLTRLEAGRETLQLEQVDACAVAREVGDVVEPLAHERGLDFHVVLPPRATPLRTDPGRLRQVLLNLVGNAVKYTEQGEVRLELSEQPDGDGILISVCDTGVGIRAEHVEHIFEPFWQVDPQNRSSNGGAGLGLSIVRRLIELLGGDISVTSRPGDGSTFTVRVPRQPPSLD